MERMEARQLGPVVSRKCDWCGDLTERGRSYCSPECRSAYNNLIARQGKTVMQMLKIWRRYRGRKGTRGEGMLTEIAERVDRILEEDRRRKKDLTRIRHHIQRQEPRR